MIVAGINESGKYRNDKILKGDSPSTQLDNLTALIEFSIDYLNYPEKPPFYTTDIIHTYKKNCLKDSQKMYLLLS